MNKLILYGIVVGLIVVTIVLMRYTLASAQTVFSVGKTITGELLLTTTNDPGYCPSGERVVLRVLVTPDLSNLSEPIPTDTVSVWIPCCIERDELQILRLNIERR